MLPQFRKKYSSVIRENKHNQEKGEERGEIEVEDSI